MICDYKGFDKMKTPETGGHMQISNFTVAYLQPPNLQDLLFPSTLHIFKKIQHFLQHYITITERYTIKWMSPLTAIIGLHVKLQWYCHFMNIQAYPTGNLDFWTKSHLELFATLWGFYFFLYNCQNPNINSKTHDSSLPTTVYSH